MKKHILSIWVENQTGVLSRVSALFSEASLNIESLAVGVTENSSASRITIVYEDSDEVAAAIISSMNQIANVIKVKEISRSESVLRELALIMVDAPEDRRPAIINIVDIFRAQIVDVSLYTMTVEASGDQDKIQALVDLLKPFGVREIVRTGIIAIDRGIRRPVD